LLKRYEPAIRATGFITALGAPNARHIKPRHGPRNKKEGELYYRWCFSDLTMARAFVEQFGGTLYAG
jgi:hypothetical protein